MKRKDRETDMTKVILSFLDFTKALKINAKRKLYHLAFSSM